jgi:hypothetical protein
LYFSHPRTCWLLSLPTVHWHPPFQIIPEPTAPFRAQARGEGTNSARLFTPGERNALAKSIVHQVSRTNAWLTVHGWSSSVISKYVADCRSVVNSEHWLVKFEICIITTAWRQRNNKHFLQVVCLQDLSSLFKYFNIQKTNILIYATIVSVFKAIIKQTFNLKL